MITAGKGEESRMEHLSRGRDHTTSGVLGDDTLDVLLLTLSG